MKNKILIPALAVLILSSMTLTYGAEQASVAKSNAKGACPLQKEFQPPHHGHHMMPPPNCKAQKPDFAAKKAEFEKRLKLTDEQKAQIKANKEKDRETMKPVFEQIKAKHEQFRKIDADTSLTKETKEKQKQELRKEIKDLKIQADNLRKENMKSFESVLTEKQKKEFEKIKKEQKKEMEKKQKEFQKKVKAGKEIGLPVMPPPPKFEE